MWAAWTGELIFFAPTIALGIGMLTGTYLIAKSSYMAGRILRNNGMKVPHTGTYTLGVGTVTAILGIIFSEKSSLNTKTERMVLRGSTLTAICGYIY